MIINYYWFAV